MFTREKDELRRSNDKKLGTSAAPRRTIEAPTTNVRPLYQRRAGVNNALMLTDIAILSPTGRNPGRAHGGITPVIRTLAEAFKEAGLTVELVTLTPDNPQRPIPGLPGGIKCRTLGSGHRRKQVQRLGAYLEQERPRALLAAGHRANVLAAQCPRGDTRVVLSVHNALSPGLTRLNPFRRWRRLSALRRYYPLADAIVCVSDGVATDLAHLVPAAQAKTTTVHNPVAPTDADGAAPMHPWLLDARVPVILGAGRLTAQKDFANLIRAFAALRQEPNPRLLILGEGSAREDLLRLAARLGVADRVALPGFVPNPRAHMAAASVFVLSSRWEGFGNVLLEAMSSGTPVVATDCPSGPREILAHGAFGQLVPVGDHEALSAAIDESLSLPLDAQAARMRAAAFAPAQVAGRYLDVLLYTDHA